MIDEKLDKPRLKDSLEIALRIGKGIVIVNQKDNNLIFSTHFACEKCNISLPKLEP